MRQVRDAKGLTVAAQAARSTAPPTGWIMGESLLWRSKTWSLANNTANPCASAPRNGGRKPQTRVGSSAPFDGSSGRTTSRHRGTSRVRAKGGVDDQQWPAKYLREIGFPNNVSKVGANDSNVSILLT